MWLGPQMPTQPDIVEAMLRSALLADMDPTTARDLALRFEVRPFSKGQTLIAAGAGGRALLEVLAGTADVFVRDGVHRYRVAQIEAGGITGEGAFFSGDSRAADVIGSSEGLVAVLPISAYLTLVRGDNPAAEALERAVLSHLGRRVSETDARLTALLSSRERGGLKGALGAIFGFTETAPVVDHG